MMFCAEDIGRSLQRFCWPPPPTGAAVLTAANFVDQRNVLPSLMIPSMGLQPPSTCFVLPPPLPPQQLPVSFSATAISPPFQQQRLGNFAVYSTPAAAGDCDNNVRSPGMCSRFHLQSRLVDEMPVQHSSGRHRRHPSAENCEPHVDSSKGDGGNGNRTAGVRRRSQTTTSFSIADILEGRIGSGEGGNKRRRTQPPFADGMPSISDKDGCRPDEPVASIGCRLSSGPELVRPWNKSDLASDLCRSEDSGSRRSSSSSMSAASPEVNNDDDDDDDEDVDNDEDDEDVDVDDAGLATKRQTTSGSQAGLSSSTVCPLGALLRMTSQTNFDTSPGSGLQDCLAAFDGKHSMNNCLNGLIN